MEEALGFHRLQERAYLFDGVVILDAIVREAIALETALQVRALEIVAHIAGDAGRTQGGSRSRWRIAADGGRQDLFAVRIHEMIVPERPENFRHKGGSGAGQLGNFAHARIIRLLHEGTVVAPQAESRAYLINVLEVRSREHVGGERDGGSVRQRDSLVAGGVNGPQ